MIVLSAAGLSEAPIGLKVYGAGTMTTPYSFKAVFIEKTVHLSNVSVALDDSITLKFYAPVERFDDAGVNKVTLSGPNATIDITSFGKDDTGSYYVFSYLLYATQLDEDVTIQFKKGSNVVKIKSEHEIYDEFSYKINDYCDYILQDTDDIFDIKTRKAAYSLQNLGLASENYFGGTNEIIFLDDTDDVMSELTDVYGADFTSDEAKLSLVLDSKLSARLYIDGLSEGDKSDDNAYTAIAGLDGKACFELTNLDPTDLGGIYGIEYNGKTYSFSALSYCARAINNTTNPNAPVIAQAVYEYYKYVERYVSL